MKIGKVLLIIMIMLSMLGCGAPDLQMLDGDGMVYIDKNYRTEFANALPFDLIDAYPYWAAAFLGKGDEGEVNKDYYINKLFSGLPEESKDKIKSYDLGGDDWFLVISRYGDEDCITYKQDGEDKKIKLYGGAPFIIKCNSTDENSDVKIANFIRGGNEFSIKTDSRQRLVYAEEVWDITEYGHRALEDISLPFTDVAKDAWYYPYIAVAYDYSIISGKSKDSFDPDAGITCAEAAKIAACIHNYQTGEKENFAQEGAAYFGANWYDIYVDYCRRNLIIAEDAVFDWNKNATKAEIAYMLSRCDALPYYTKDVVGDIYDISFDDIPDVDKSTPYAVEIWKLYNRGIAEGDSKDHRFYPNSEVKRSEAAVMISKTLCQNMRTKQPS